MKEFLGVWLCMSLMLFIALIFVCAAFVGGLSFIFWDMSPIYNVIKQVDWLSARVLIAVCLVVGAVFAIGYLNE